MSEQKEPRRPGLERDIWIKHFCKAIEEYNRIADDLYIDRLPVLTGGDISKYRLEHSMDLEQAMIEIVDFMAMLEKTRKMRRRFDRLIALYMGLRLGLSAEPELLFENLLKHSGSHEP